jgi:YVTN family beta-propeller protein
VAYIDFRPNTFMKKITPFIYLSLFIFLSADLSAQTKVGYEIVNRIHLDGDGGWDYLTMDDATGLLYVSHGNMVQVVDVKLSIHNVAKVVATIEDTKGVHGITIATEFGKGYISCGRDSTVVVFDTKTFKTLSRVKVNGRNPDAILYDPFSKNVFVFNGRSNNVTVIDAKSDKIAGNIPLDGNPEFAATDENGKIYLNIEDKSKLCVINSQTLKVEQYWPIGPVVEPSGLAIDNTTHRLFTVSDGHMAVIDALTGKIIAALPIGERVDGVAFDKGYKRAYSANGDGTMTVVGEVDGKYKVIETVKTQKGARTIAVSSKTGGIYLPTADQGESEPGKRPSIKPGTFVILVVGTAEEVTTTEY